jgi:alpha-beta hydrolase superfamily lysophospholipase
MCFMTAPDEHTAQTLSSASVLDEVHDGFPELAYSWRKVMPVLASVGYHVIAPDLRGCGRSSGSDVKFDDDMAPFRSRRL